MEKNIKLELTQLEITQLINALWQAELTYMKIAYHEKSNCKQIYSEMAKNYNMLSDKLKNMIEEPKRGRR